jgi:uncharacterized protein YndB with AHSA1/START domain
MNRLDVVVAMIASDRVDVQPMVAHKETKRNRQLHMRGIVMNVVPDTIAREIDIEAPPDVVWAIVTEARHLVGWFSDEATIDLRPGGEMVLAWHDHGTYRARIETVEPPRTFAFRWVLREGAEPVQGGSTLVVMTLTPQGEGTRLQVVESGFSELSWAEDERAGYADQNARGWVDELDELRAYAVRATASRASR